MALKDAAAVAFSRTGDPSFGDLDPAVVLGDVGDCRTIYPRCDSYGATIRSRRYLNKNDLASSFGHCSALAPC